MKKHIESLSINITDLCSMRCAHCMRGDGSGRKLDLSFIPKIFGGIDTVSCVTVTGGEPSCYVEAVTAIADYILDHREDLDVGGFYIVTNGAEYREELVQAVKKVLFLYLEKSYGADYAVRGGPGINWSPVVEELSYSFGVAVSLDEFHPPIPFLNYMKYRTCGIYSTVKEQDFSRCGVIDRGRGRFIGGGIWRDLREFRVDKDDETDTLSCDEVYVNTEGLVFGDCDMSYEMEEYSDPAGDLDEESLGDIMERHAHGETEEE